MNVTEIKGVFHCDCGFSWRLGTSGHHNCGDGLRAKLKAAEAKVLELNVAVAARTDVIERLIGQYSAAGLHAVQNSHNPGCALLYDALQTLHQPDTDVFLHDAWADGVEMFAAKLRIPGGDPYLDAACSGVAGAADDFAAQLRKGAAA